VHASAKAIGASCRAFDPVFRDYAMRLPHRIGAQHAGGSLHGHG
jgi:hypothetical protein